MTLQKLPLPEHARSSIRMIAYLGFGVRVSRGGSKTCVRAVGKERHRTTIGR
jgi:hypothetical protein